MQLIIISYITNTSSSSSSSSTHFFLAIIIAGSSVVGESHVSVQTWIRSPGCSSDLRMEKCFAHEHFIVKKQ